LAKLHDLIDEKETVAKMNKYSENIGKRAAKQFFEINGINATYIKENKL